MKKILFMMAVALVAFTACQKQAQVTETVYTVGDVLAQGDSLAGDTVLVEGYCMHLCKHGGRKAFLNGGEQGVFLRCNAVDFEAFAPECLNNNLRVRGVVQAIDVPVEGQTVADEHHHEGEESCAFSSTVRKYYVNAVSYEIITE
jgi:hypothetical protein